jgi:hypothetical protein
MWRAESEQLPGGQGARFCILASRKVLTARAVLDAWREDMRFRTFFNQLLADAPYRAFRWETPPLTLARFEEPFEFVLLDSPALERNVDRHSFAEHFRDKAEVAVFENLGRDATLVVPCPRNPADAYGHLAAFVREAPVEQCDALWRAVGQAMHQRLASRPEDPVWLSTAGMGVAWLHVRLDDRPKYYGHAAYRHRPDQ